jgi:cysteinyl-tRNA synthetase
LDLLKGAAERKKIPAEIKKLAQYREQLRQQKNFEEADNVRKKIENAGFSVKDSTSGPILRQKKSA